MSCDTWLTNNQFCFYFMEPKREMSGALLNHEELRQVVALTIAGSDSGGNAGIQADLRVFHGFGVHGCTVLSALTAQNPFGVRAVVTLDAAFVTAQLDAVFDAYTVIALKTGMLSSPELIESVADCLMLQNRIIKVIDPVMVASSGAVLLQDDAIDVLLSRLLPLATLITPNLPETAVLTGRQVSTHAEMADAARALSDRFNCAVLVKGGHGSMKCAEDVLCDGSSLLWFATPRIIEPLSTHGTGCSLSAAITALLARGACLVDAVREGKAYVYEAIRAGVWVGEAVAVLGTPARVPVDLVTISEERF